MVNVSVIVPFYNGTKTIRDTLNKLLAQTYKSFEIVIVDDGSPEPVEDVLDELINHPQIRLVKQDNGGVAAARNTGINNAQGEFIAFCDQDDIWSATKLEKQLPYFDDDNTGLVYTWTKAINAKGIEEIISPCHEGNCFEQLAHKNFITCCTVVVRKRLLREIGYFNDDRQLQGVDDRYVWMRLARISKLAVVKEPLATYVIHGENYSLNNHKMLSADEYCLKIISELSDLTPAEKKLCILGLEKVYLHYANNFLYRNDYPSASQCYQKLWNMKKWRVDLLVLSILFSILPASFFNFLKKIRKSFIAKTGNQ